MIEKRFMYVRVINGRFVYVLATVSCTRYTNVQLKTNKHTAANINNTDIHKAHKQATYVHVLSNF